MLLRRRALRRHVESAVVTGCRVRGERLAFTRVIGGRPPPFRPVLPREFRTYPPGTVAGGGAVLLLPSDPLTPRWATLALVVAFEQRARTTVDEQIVDEPKRLAAESARRVDGLWIGSRSPGVRAVDRRRRRSPRPVARARCSKITLFAHNEKASGSRGEERLSTRSRPLIEHW